MRFAIFFTILALAWSLTPEDIEKISGKKWKAGHSPISDMPLAEFKKLVRVPLPPVEQMPMMGKYNPSVLNQPGIPDSFDARTQWPTCVEIGKIRNQAHCGSCWAFAGAESLGDRFCANDDDHGALSPQDLVSCDYLDSGCNGGNLESEWSWMKSTGICTDDCMGYKSANGTVPACPVTCDDLVTPIVRYKAKRYAHIQANQIQQDLSKNGPIEVAFYVYEDFRSYKSGVYHHVTGSLLGGHAVKLIGWGVDGSTPYWLIANSWDVTWGEQGFFRILRGKNECSIESMVYAGYV